MSTPIEFFQYRPTRLVHSMFPGAHPGQMVSSGQLFKRHEPLIARPDPRRIDLRSSVLDPFSSYKVRVQQQHSVLDVYLLADLSASMAFAGKRQVIVDFLLSAAGSALDYGDNFGFVGCGQQIRDDSFLPASRHMGRIRGLAEQLQKQAFDNSSESLLQTHNVLPAHRALIFLLSDFHFDLDWINRIMPALNRHDVVPLVLWDAAEYAGLPDWGLVDFQDMENRARRTLLMRPGLKLKIAEAFKRRKQSLQHRFRAFGAEPLFIEGAFKAAQLTVYFQQRAA